MTLLTNFRWFGEQKQDHLKGGGLFSNAPTVGALVAGRPFHLSAPTALSLALDSHPCCPRAMQGQGGHWARLALTGILPCGPDVGVQGPCWV